VDLFSWNCFCIVFSSTSCLRFICENQGLGVVCNKPEGFDDGDFVVEFFGEVHTTILGVQLPVLCIRFCFEVGCLLSY
jgi:hypothetical protein